MSNFSISSSGAAAAASVIDPRWVEDLGSWDATTAVPAVGPQGGFYRVAKPATPQAVNLVGGSGNVTIDSPGRIWTDGVAWFWEPFGSGSAVEHHEVANIAARDALTADESWTATLDPTTSNGLSYVYDDNAWIVESLLVKKPVTVLPSNELVDNQVVLLQGYGWFRNDPTVGWFPECSCDDEIAAGPVSVGTLVANTTTNRLIADGTGSTAGEGALTNYRWDLTFDDQAGRTLVIEGAPAAAPAITDSAGLVTALASGTSEQWEVDAITGDIYGDITWVLTVTQTDGQTNANA